MRFAEKGERHLLQAEALYFTRIVVRLCNSRELDHWVRWRRSFYYWRIKNLQKIYILQNYVQIWCNRSICKCSYIFLSLSFLAISSLTRERSPSAISKVNINCARRIGKTLAIGYIARTFEIMPKRQREISRFGLEENPIRQGIMIVWEIFITYSSLISKRSFSCFLFFFFSKNSCIFQARYYALFFELMI